MSTSSLIWLRRYVIIGAVIIGVALAWAAFSYHRFINTPMQGGWDGYRVREFTMNFSPYLLFLLLLLLPWWRLNRVVFSIGFTLFLLFGALVAWVVVWTLWHDFRQVWGSLFLLSVYVAHSTWLFKLPSPESIAPDHAFLPTARGG